MDKNKTDPDLLKRAKHAVRWNFLLHNMISDEFHEAMVRLECCSKYFLRSYIRDYSLSLAAEVLMVEEHAAANPELIAFYVSRQNASDAMRVKIAESKNLILLKHIARATSGYLNHFCFSKAAQIAVVRLNDAEYFRKVRELFPECCPEAVSEIIKLQNVEMFDNVFLSAIEINVPQQEMLLEQNNAEMIACFLKHQKNFNANLQHLIIEQDNALLLEKIIEKNRLSEAVEFFLAKKGSKKMIAQYIQRWPLCSAAQIELVKHDYRDLLKLHFLKHGISERALLYQVSLNQFKAYIGL